MRTINKSLQQLAGNSELYITPIVNITSIVGSVVTLSFSHLLLQIIASRDSIQHVATSKKTNNGTLYTHSVTASILFKSDQTDALLDEFAIYKLMAIIKDSNGVYRAIGTPSLGLGMDWQHDTGNDPSSKIGYNITLSGSLPSNSFLIDFPVIQ